MDRWTADIKLRKFTEKKTNRALEAEIPGFETLEDYSGDFKLERVAADGWAEDIYGGPFYRSFPKNNFLPAISVVFVQDKNGNTDTESGNPGDLGGGETDLHGIYEGFSRIDADAVLAGANTIRGSGIIFGVWHPGWMKIRNKSRFWPAQIIVSASGNIDIKNELMFNLPIDTYIITTARGANKLRLLIPDKGFVNIVSTGESLDLEKAMRFLKSGRGINKISLVGGRTTATEFFDRGLVSDLYLTTSPLETGKSDTPFYVGKKGLPPKNLVLRKKGKGPEKGVIFEHYVF